MADCTDRLHQLYDAILAVGAGEQAVRVRFGERQVEFGPAKLNDMIRVYRMLYRQCGAGSGLPDLATGLQQRGGPVGGIFS